MKNKRLLILSSNDSGTHIFSLMLGRHSKAEHFEELKNLYKGANSRNFYICHDVEGCRLFSGINDAPRDSLYHTLFERVRSRIEILVNASKKPKGLKHFASQNEFDIRLIHLIRNARALADAV